MGVNINRAAMHRDLQQAGLRWGNRIGRRIVNEAKEECPVDEGALRSSLSHVVIQSGTKTTTIVGSEEEYAKYVNDGTGIHGPHQTPIVPVSAKALKFRASMKGAQKRPSKDKRPWVFAKSVAGQKANPFLARALRNVLGDIVRDNPRGNQ
ncbi:HK97 gp10 family phage protein [Gordonia sp. TBRC 11910]|uniref:HK97 gp10 family phage protein n=1 Tax=Gordonia asplenii TaxID=2725283 RepID=A0A848KXB7_9ACTN|nr:HK97 gp10 family phage protein [Gordonia asplenii]NMO00831.1 HK97 gp10 family phage protein [Gordonia asplenii]